MGSGTSSHNAHHLFTWSIHFWLKDALYPAFSKSRAQSHHAHMCKLCRFIQSLDQYAQYVCPHSRSIWKEEDEKKKKVSRPSPDMIYTRKGIINMIISSKTCQTFFVSRYKPYSENRNHLETFISIPSRIRSIYRSRRTKGLFFNRTFWFTRAKCLCQMTDERNPYHGQRNDIAVEIWRGTSILALIVPRNEG